MIYMLLFMVVKIIDSFGLEVILVISVFDGLVGIFWVWGNFVDLFGIVVIVFNVEGWYILRMRFFLFNSFVIKIFKI